MRGSRKVWWCGALLVLVMASVVSVEGLRWGYSSFTGITGLFAHSGVSSSPEVLACGVKKMFVVERVPSRVQGSGLSLFDAAMNGMVGAFVEEVKSQFSCPSGAVKVVENLNTAGAYPTNLALCSPKQLKFNSDVLVWSCNLPVYMGNSFDPKPSALGSCKC